jgi:hypothetical protein
MQFIIPTFERKEKPSGVYKITFDNQWFYIGSSKNLRTRFIAWRTMLSHKKWLKSINIKRIWNDVYVVKIEIIRLCLPQKRHLFETQYIQENWDNPLLLNRCPKGDTNTGMRPYIGYKKPIKKVRPKSDYVPVCKKVALFENNGQLIKIFPSRTQAAKELKVSSDAIIKIFAGKRGQFIKYKIKEVADDGSFIDSPIFKPRPNPNPVPNKPVHQIDNEGNIVATHHDFRAAAKVLKCSSTLVHRVLKGNPKYRCKRAKGFILKYA